MQIPINSPAEKTTALVCTSIAPVITVQDCKGLSLQIRLDLQEGLSTYLSTLQMIPYHFEIRGDRTCGRPALVLSSVVFMAASALRSIQTRLLVALCREQYSALSLAAWKVLTTRVWWVVLY